MSNTEKKQQTPQEMYASARGAFMFFVIATVMNIVLGMFSSKWNFPFTSELIALVCGLGEGVLYDILGLCAAALLAGLWYLTEKRRGLMTAAAGIYLADSILAVMKIVSGQTDTMVLLCVVIRLLLMWAMLMGIKAAKLMDKAEKEPMIILEETAEEPAADDAENNEN